MSTKVTTNSLTLKRQGCILFNAIVHNSDITQALGINFCLLTLSDLGVSWVLESTKVGNQMAQVAPKSDDSNLYFF